MIVFFALLLVIFGSLSIIIAANEESFIGLIFGIIALFFSGLLFGSDVFKQDHQKQGAMMYYKGEYKAKVTYEIINDSLVPTDTIIIKCKN